MHNVMEVLMMLGALVDASTSSSIHAALEPLFMCTWQHVLA